MMNNFIKVSEKHPPPHTKYLVKKNDYFFTATPCYEMHSPWWIVMTMNEEVQPVKIVKIEETDYWIELVKFNEMVK